MSTKDWDGLVTKLESTPQNQRIETLLTGISQIMQQQSNAQQCNQLGTELQQFKAQFIKQVQGQVQHA